MKKLTLAIFCSLTLAFGCLGGSESEENNDQHSNDTYSYDESSGPDNQADLNTLDMSIFKEMDRSAPAPETEQEMRELYGWVEGVFSCDAETSALRK